MKQRNNAIEKGNWLLGGLGLGAALMYLFDPDRGNRRRALLRDKCIHTTHRMGNAVSSVGGACRDLSNRSYGVLSEATHWFSREKVNDETLTARVRSRLGHLIFHPGSIDVSAKDRDVILSGSIPTDELNHLLSGVAEVRGVNKIESRLKLQSHPAETDLAAHTTSA